MGTFVLNHLGAFAACQNAGNGFGQFLTALGFGDANGAALAQIQQTLNIINAKLDALKNSVDEIRTAVEKARCENIQTSLGETQAAIKEAWKRFGEATTAARGADSATQKQVAKDLREGIQAEFAGTTPGRAATRIHDALEGTPGSPSMIAVCGVAFQQSAGDFVSLSLYDQVVAMTNYWQALEAQAAVLDIGLKVADSRSASAESEHNATQRGLDSEVAKIKPSLEDMVFDTRTHMAWRRTIRPVANFADADRAAPPGWKLPTFDELKELARNCCGGDGRNGYGWFFSSTPFKFDLAGVREHKIISSSGCLVAFTRERCALNLAAGYLYSTVTDNIKCLAAYTKKVGEAEWAGYLYQS